jgi:Domain of unknown function (DUF3806)
VLDPRLRRRVLPAALLLLGACSRGAPYQAPASQRDGGSVRDPGAPGAAGPGHGITEEWTGEQKLSAPRPQDLDELRRHVSWVDAQVRFRYGTAGLTGRASDLEVLQRLVDDGAVRADDTLHLQSLGAALGEVLVKELGFHWVVVEDRYGRDLAVKFKSTSVLVFPLTMISRRVERRERPDVLDLFEAVQRDLPKYVSGADRKPG